MQPMAIPLKTFWCVLTVYPTHVFEAQLLDGGGGVGFEAETVEGRGGGGRSIRSRCPWPPLLSDDECRCCPILASEIWIGSKGENMILNRS